MRKILAYITFLILPLASLAQLHVLSDQYVFNGLAINPAYAGSEDALSATLMYRNQWVGFSGAPKTLTGAIHSPLGKERVALGLLVLNDIIGVNSQTSIMGNYAYKIEAGPGKLSFGVGVGVTLLDIGWDELKTIQIDDIELLGKSEQVSNPNFSAGVYYKSKQMFLGVSVPFFLSYAYNSSDKSIDLKNDISEYNYHILGGYIFDISPKLKFQPSALLKYHAGNAVQVDISPLLILKERMWMGLTFRTNDALAALIQFALTEQFKFAYSYDFDISKTGSYHRNSHEVMLKFVLGYKALVAGPKRF
ncbi:MAG: type IX secretion system membrane protein PorP/SprF [Bacteroidales bacterium]|nr:type IX secretion system membrane protein PorP/SprF [Bacteroidales bacterium]